MGLYWLQMLRKEKFVLIFNKNGKLVQSFAASVTIGADIVELGNGNIAVSIPEDKLIEVYTPHGELVEKFGSDVLESPTGLAVSNKGQLFVVDTDNRKVFVYSEDGEFQYTFDSRGSDPGEFEHPYCICIGQDGLVYVGGSEQDGQFLHQFSENVPWESLAIATFVDSHIVVTSAGINKLSIFTPSGECVHEVEYVGLSNPRGVVVDENGFIFVTDCCNHRIVMF